MSTTKGRLQRVPSNWSRLVHRDLLGAVTKWVNQEGLELTTKQVERLVWKVGRVGRERLRDLIREECAKLEKPPPIAIETLRIPTRGVNALREAGIRTLEQACQQRAEEIASIAGFGEYSMACLRRAAVNHRRWFKGEGPT